MLSTQTSLFSQPKPAIIRIWHWLTALFFFASIGTVLLNSTLFKTKDNIAMVQEQVTQKGGTINAEQAKAVAHEYSDKLWMAHKFIGFGIVFLFLLRIVAEVVVSKENKLISKVKSALTLPVTNEERKHYLLVKYSYTIFYLLLFLMSITGLILAFEDVELFSKIHKPVKQFHGFLQYTFYAFIGLHIIGVVKAELTDYAGIVSGMIHGKKE